MKANWCVIGGIILGLVIWSFFDIRSVYAGWTGTYMCGHVVFNAAACSDGNGMSTCTSGNLGLPCHSGAGTSVCTSDGDCVADSDPVNCDGSSCSTANRGCTASSSCAWSCDPGACVSSGDCYMVAGQCVQDGWNGCSSCFNDCDSCGAAPTSPPGATDTPTPAPTQTCAPQTDCSSSYLGFWYSAILLLGRPTRS
jgi:hypothetical protein